MTVFELNNDQRRYFGLDPIKPHWKKVILKGDSYRPNSLLYFEDDTLKRQIISTDDKYYESHYDELTRDQSILLPKTSKGKERALTAASLEQRKPKGVYLNVTNRGEFLVANYTTNTTFYSSRWETSEFCTTQEISRIISKFLDDSPENHLTEIDEFRRAKRKHVRFKSGDYFSFKLSRTSYGFGRVLLDINKVRKKGLINEKHGLNLIMGPPVLVQLFAFTSDSKKIDVSTLDTVPKLPSDLMMDNLLLYGEYEIIGHKELSDEEFDFPISYGKSIDRRPIVFLQWGLIHRELPTSDFDKYTVGDNLKLAENNPSRKIQNPFGYYSIGFRPSFDARDILRTIENRGVYDYDSSAYYRAQFDLRNPRNESVKREILNAFGLNPDKTYVENCKSTGTVATTEILRQLSP